MKSLKYGHFKLSSLNEIHTIYKFEDEEFLDIEQFIFILKRLHILKIMLVTQLNIICHHAQYYCGCHRVFQI